METLKPSLPLRVGIDLQIKSQKLNSSTKQSFDKAHRKKKKKSESQIEQGQKVFPTKIKSGQTHCFFF